MAVERETTGNIPTLGVLELSSIAKGLQVCDRMFKKADVRVLRATPVGCGKFLILVTGDEANLLEAIEEGRAVGDDFIIGWTYIPNIHSEVVLALSRKGRADISMDSVGVMESSSLASAIRAADVAAKISDVRIIELTFDLDMGGKAYFTMTGNLADMEAAMEAAERHLHADAAYVHGEILARPHEEMGAIVRGTPCC